MSFVITATQLGSTGNGTERITHVYVSALGWTSVADVVRKIDHGYSTFLSGSSRGPLVETAVSSRGHKFIRTEANGTTSDNLLQLPQY